jgi:hypothetical protein
VDNQGIGRRALLVGLGAALAAPALAAMHDALCLEADGAAFADAEGFACETVHLVIGGFVLGPGDLVSVGGRGYRITRVRLGVGGVSLVEAEAEAEAEVRYWAWHGPCVLRVT